jgi:PLP dependent protein
MMSDIKKKLKAVRDILPSDVQLIAVSKTHPSEIILDAYNEGQRFFGENKVQELLEKYEKLPKDIEWHIIGHLQTNKVKQIAPFISLIESVDSLKLLKEIDKQAAKYGRKIPILLQVYIATEESKFGLDQTELELILDRLNEGSFPNVSLRGFMGMATFTSDKERISKEFSFLQGLFEKYKNSPSFTLDILSMGMSGDYLIAIENGATHVRVGSAIFGSR